MQKELTNRLFAQYVAPLESMGYALVSIEWTTFDRRRTLVFYVDRLDGGITMDECEKISIYLSRELDNMEELDFSYDLSVSSPGLDRPLLTDADFRRSKDKLLEVKLYRKINGKKHFDAFLEDYDEKSITVSYEGNSEVIQRSDIAKMTQKIVF